MALPPKLVLPEFMRKEAVESLKKIQESGYDYRAVEKK